jgi:hypothetical protein
MLDLETRRHEFRPHSQRNVVHTHHPATQHFARAVPESVPPGLQVTPPPDTQLIARTTREPPPTAQCRKFYMRPRRGAKQINDLARLVRAFSFLGYPFGGPYRMSNRLSGSALQTGPAFGRQGSEIQILSRRPISRRFLTSFPHPRPPHSGQSCPGYALSGCVPIPAPTPFICHGHTPDDHSPRITPTAAPKRVVVRAACV